MLYHGMVLHPVLILVQLEWFSMFLKYHRINYLSNKVNGLSCSDLVKLAHSSTISDVDAGAYFASRILCILAASVTIGSF
jgi:hypothetical protein